MIFRIKNSYSQKKKKITKEKNPRRKNIPKGKKSQRGKRGSKRTKKHFKKNYTILSFIENLISFHGNLKTRRFCTPKEINRLSMKQLKTFIWEYVDNTKNLHNHPTEVSESWWWIWLIFEFFKIRKIQRNKNLCFLFPYIFKAKMYRE